jgi:hypothetical protein
MMIGGVSMSILGKVIEFVASDAIVDALDVPIRALDKASKKLDAKNMESKRKLFEKNNLVLRFWFSNSTLYLAKQVRCL